MDSKSYNFDVVRSRRKTVAVEIRPDGSALIRAPYSMPNSVIKSFISEHEYWIEEHIKKAREKRKELGEIKPLTREELLELVEQARGYLPPRIKHYADILGVKYGMITIRNQHTRWGSCSAKGNLNFNCLLMLMPEEVRDYVVVHELCHRLEMNHSKRFWSLVEGVMPDYKRIRKLLDEEGSKVMLRNP